MGHTDTQTHRGRFNSLMRPFAQSLGRVTCVPRSCFLGPISTLPPSIRGSACDMLQSRECAAEWRALCSSNPTWFGRWRQSCRDVPSAASTSRCCILPLYFSPTLVALDIPFPCTAHCLCSVPCVAHSGRHAPQWEQTKGALLSFAANQTTNIPGRPDTPVASMRLLSNTAPPPPPCAPVNALCERLQCSLLYTAAAVRKFHITYWTNG